MTYRNAVWSFFEGTLKTISIAHSDEPAFEVAAWV
jgi:hypothetical protein